MRLIRSKRTESRLDKKTLPCRQKRSDIKKRSKSWKELSNISICRDNVVIPQCQMHYGWVFQANSGR